MLPDEPRVAEELLLRREAERKLRECEAENARLAAEVDQKGGELSAVHQCLRDAKEENKALRGLVECAECGEGLGAADYHGWMPGLCLDCQAERFGGGKS